MTQTATDTKLIYIVSSRPRKEVPVEVTPQDTAAGVLEKAGLTANDQMLMRPGDQADYAPTEIPFNDVPDGGKLHVVPLSTVGGEQ